jgi:osmoprotectant transport system permease protein
VWAELGLTVLALATPAIGGDTVVIGSKNFTESHILGEVMALLLEEHTELEVEHKSGLGGTLVCMGALRSGEIDLYPDYTGTGLSVVLEEERTIGDPLQAFLHVEDEFRRRFDVEWLQPFGLNNTYALAVRSEKAAALGLTRISDLVPHARELRGGFSAEFTQRPDGYAGLSPFYDLELGSVRAMEHSLAYEALAGGELDVVDAYSTDAKLLRYGLTVLEDDRGFFPPYNAAALARGDLLRRHPEVRTALERAAFRISDEAMLHMNYAVEVDGRGFREVARAFLEREGLLEPLAEPATRTTREGFLPFFLGRWRETLRLLVEHLQLTLISVLLAAAFAIPLGVWISSHALAQRISLGLAGVVQTIPSLALLAVMIAVPGLGLSVRSAIVALFLYAILPILRNTTTGLASVDPDLVDAAKGMGLRPRQVLLRVQLPLATRTIMAGIRTATVISVGVATLAAFIGAGGLGEPIVTGLYLNDPHLILSGALPAALLALCTDYLLAGVERLLVPRGLRRRA